MKEIFFQDFTLSVRDVATPLFTSSGLTIQIHTKHKDKVSCKNSFSGQSQPSRDYAYILGMIEAEFPLISKRDSDTKI